MNYICPTSCIQVQAPTCTANWNPFSASDARMPAHHQHDLDQYMGTSLPATVPQADPALSQVVKLILHFGQHKKAVGAGFIFSCGAKTWLATTFHNLSGGISPMARFRDRAQPRPVMVDIVHQGKSVARFSPYAKGKSLFQVHPDPCGIGGCDVATLELETLAEHKTDGAHNTLFWTLPGLDTTTCGAPDCDGYALVSDMFLPTGHDALVFGYPGGYDYRDHPIGVSCKIAAQAGDVEPCLLLSGHTTSGCSGAPVIAREFGGYFSLSSDGLKKRRPDTALVDQWLGLYSGRLENTGPGQQPHNTQIGVVWSALTAQEVARDGVRDRIG